MSQITKVEARFFCDSVGQLHEKIVTLNMHADYNNGNGNEDFAISTPWGQLTMGITIGRPAAEFFKQGKRYRITFEECESN